VLACLPSSLWLPSITLAAGSYDAGKLQVILLARPRNQTVNGVVEGIAYRPRDVLFLLLVATCLALSAAAIFSGLEKREAAHLLGGARSVDAAKIRKQILDGNLAPRKALFYKKVPR
jgi:hypothetical protein